mmetsp:Transcript_88781/g.276008  ORF Transcript_88781/g.276008 Transcript_88781/m.276008 type:complete len:223 (+) Transcript_88781:95-763(+)
MVAATGNCGVAMGRIVVVRLRRARLAARLAGGRLRAVVKYGGRGRAVACETGAAACGRCDDADKDALPVAADLDSACVFLWDPSSDPLVRLQLVRTGISDEVVATAEFVIRFFGSDRELELRAGSEPGRPPVGLLSLRVDSLMLPRSEIRRGLHLAQACTLEDVPLVDNGASLCPKQPCDALPGACLADDSEVIWAAGRPCGKWPMSSVRPLMSMAALLGIA